MKLAAPCRDKPHVPDRPEWMTESVSVNPGEPWSACGMRDRDLQGVPLRGAAFYEARQRQPEQHRARQV
jgi:hypothetical protein